LHLLSVASSKQILQEVFERKHSGSSPSSSRCSSPVSEGGPHRAEAGGNNIVAAGDDEGKEEASGVSTIFHHLRITAMQAIRISQQWAQVGFLSVGKRPYEQFSFRRKEATRNKIPSH